MRFKLHFIAGGDMVSSVQSRIAYNAQMLIALVDVM